MLARPAPDPRRHRRTASAGTLTARDANRRRSLVRNPDFLQLWTAETISQFGTQVSLLAMPLVAVALLQATPFEVALLGTIEFLPFILFSLPAGAWVDRLRRRPILIVGDIGRAVACSRASRSPTPLGVLTIWQLYVVGFVVGTLTVFFDVAYQSYLPALVERDQLVEGNAKLEISRTVGPDRRTGHRRWADRVLTAPDRDLRRRDQLRCLGRSSSSSSGKHGADPGPPRRRARRGRARACARRSPRACATCSATDTCAASRPRPATSNLFRTSRFATFIVYAVRELGLDAGRRSASCSGSGNLGALVGRRDGRPGPAAGSGSGPTIVGSMLAQRRPALLLIALAPTAVADPVPASPSGVLTGFSARRLQHQPGQLPPGHHARPRCRAG